MKKWNKKQAVELVETLCNDYIQQNGNVTYNFSGHLPEENGNRLYGHKSFYNLLKSIRNTINNTFETKPIVDRFCNVYVDGIMRKHLKVELIRFDFDGYPIEKNGVIISSDELTQTV